MTPLCSVLSRDCDIERFDLIKLLALSIRSLILYFSSSTGLFLVAYSGWRPLCSVDDKHFDIMAYKTSYSGWRPLCFELTYILYLCCLKMFCSHCLIILMNCLRNFR
ncbi:hypothetical protein L1987_29642 [Smallanthus sonchifolius]|uniref:Uncharacterized protein n=1 Tax=Smallanthus sonchifolius TaxID=185202 RepID=A0ACB9I209_9ASTR|nr:hypothetical protein L1987_29642 [Smallanthus sonchifolius]